MTEHKKLKMYDGAGLYLVALAVLQITSVLLSGLLIKASDNVYYIATLILELLLGAIPAVFWVSLRNLSFVDTFHLRRVSFGTLLCSAGIAATAYPVVIFLNAATVGFWNALGANASGTKMSGLDNPGTLLLSVAAVALAPALSEELLFRGPILESLRRLGKWPSSLICGLFFALLHFSPTSLPALFLLGVLMSLMVWETGSILPGMVIHFTNNLISIMLTAFASDSGSLPTGLPEMSDTLYLLTATYAYMPVALLGGFMCWLFYSLIKQLNPGNELPVVARNGSLWNTDTLSVVFMVLSIAVTAIFFVLALGSMYMTQP